MEETIEILLFGLFGFWIILIPMVMIMKIKYYKISRQKEYNGIPDLFAFLTTEFWIAGITIGFPIIGKDKKIELNKIRKKANIRLFRFYGIILIQIFLVILLNINMN